MQWYNGGIAEAVAASKKQGAIFVVYVEGKGEQSDKFSNSIQNEAVSRMLEGNQFVAIKVEEGTIPHQQFSEIYKQASAPSLFFIGKNGAPIEIVQHANEPDELLAKISAIAVKAGVGVNASASGENVSASLIAAETSEVCENGACQLKPSTSSAETIEISSDEKLERAKELLEQVKEKKRNEEEEKDRSKEIERRKIGQEMQKTKRWQKDQELKEMVDERNRERQENLEARRRILADIEQDRADRAARFAKADAPEQAKTPAAVAPAPMVRNANVARLQFRLPDGTSHTHDFDSSITLQLVRNYLLTNVDLPFQTFTLSTTFPKREFTEGDGGETLLALNLVPNAVILILPLHRGTISTNRTNWLDVIWAFFAPFFNLLGGIRSRLFGGASSSDADSATLKRPADDSGETSQSVPKRRLGSESTVIRRQGNIFRLTDRKDSDDENNTWNGNSTQQM